VAQRTHEIGVRVALMPRGPIVVTMVLGQGLRLTLAGVAFGAPSALALARTMASLLYGVEANDPLPRLAAAGVLMGVPWSRPEPLSGRR
jgi:putative ABC transport system permease protein